MLRYLLRRGFMALLVALTVSVAAFVLLNVAVDPAMAIAGEDADLLLVEQIREQYGFDRPIYVQYFEWLTRLFHGDFGESYYWNKPVGELILSHAPVTLQLALMAIFVTVVISIPLGTLAALKQNSLIDRIALSTAVSAQAIPNFWLGLMMIILFSVTWQIFPVSGDDTFAHFILPSFVLGASSVPAVMRLTRNGLLDVLSSDYIRTARSKGFGGIRLLLQHAMRNALLPVVSVLAVQLGQKLGGSVITESIFAINGLGRLALESILGGDIPTVQMLVFVFALTFVIMTLLADLLNAWLDPRLRLG
ncbi:MAG: ABC transporter permease [Desulfobulbaceae bacterium S3730MH12]|nr:MAG: ABC transporter permease [Desulfobulbaceae bacterium S3730MH12]